MIEPLDYYPAGSIILTDKLNELIESHNQLLKKFDALSQEKKVGLPEKWSCDCHCKEPGLIDGGKATSYWICSVSKKPCNCHRWSAECDDPNTRKLPPYNPPEQEDWIEKFEETFGPMHEVSSDSQMFYVNERIKDFIRDNFVWKGKK